MPVEKIESERAILTRVQRSDKCRNPNQKNPREINVEPLLVIGFLQAIHKGHEYAPSLALVRKV